MRPALLSLIDIYREFYNKPISSFNTLWQNRISNNSICGLPSYEQHTESQTEKGNRKTSETIVLV